MAARRRSSTGSQRTSQRLSPSQRNRKGSGGVDSSVPAATRALLRRYPCFDESYYDVQKRGHTVSRAFVQLVLTTRARLSIDELHALLQYQVAFPREYRIPPAYAADAFSIARSQLPSDEWYRRNPARYQRMRDNLDEYWDEKSAELRKKGMRIIEGPDVARQRALRKKRLERYD